MVFLVMAVVLPGAARTWPLFARRAWPRVECSLAYGAPALGIRRAPVARLLGSSLALFPFLFVAQPSLNGPLLGLVLLAARDGLKDLLYG